MDQYYVEQGYWEERYVGYQARIAVSLSNYIEEDYFEEPDYYENTGSWATLSADVSVLSTVDAGTITLTASSQQQVEFTVVKQLQADIDSAFTPTLVVDAIRNSFAVLEVNTAAEITAQRSRASVAQLQVQTVFDSTVEILAPQGEVKEFQAQLLSSTEIFVDGNLIKNTQSVIDCAFDSVVTGDRIRNYSSEQTAEFDFTVTSLRIKDTAANMSAEFALLSSAGRIQQAQCNFEALFAPSFTANAVTNTFAVLDSTAALATVATANRSADIALASIINLGLQGDKVTGYVAALDAEFQQTADNLRTRNQSAQLSADFVVSAVNDRTRTDTAAVSAEFVTVTVNERTRNSAALVNVVSSLDAEVKEIVQIGAVVTASTTVITALSIEKQFSADLGALFAPNFSANAVTNTFAVLDTVSAMSITAVKSAPVTAQLAVSAQQTVTGLRVRPYVSTTITGLRVDESRLLRYVDEPLDLLSLNNSVFSIWAKRDKVKTQTIIDHSRWYYFYQGPGGPLNEIIRKNESFNLGLSDNNFVFTGVQIGGPGSPSVADTLTWNSVVNDFEWHHYLVQTTITGQGFGRRINMKLFVDGLDQGTRSFAGGLMAYYYTVDFSDTLNLGYDGVFQNSPTPTSAVANKTAFEGSLAQLWVGQRTLEQLDIEEFYNQGYVQSLPPTFVVYDDLTQPYSEQLEGRNNNNQVVVVDNNNFGNNLYALQGPLTAQALINIQPRSGLFVIASIGAEFTATINAVTIGTNEILAQASSDLSVDLSRIRNLSVQAPAEFTQTITAFSSNFAEADLTVSADINVSAVKTTNTSAELATNTTFTADATITSGSVAQLSTQFQQVTDSERTRTAAAELSGFAAVIQVTSKIAGFFVNCDLVSTMTTTAITNVDNNSEQTAEFQQTATARKITDVTLVLASTLQQTTDAKRFRSTVEEFDVTASITVATEFSKITRTGAAEYTAEFAQSTVTDTSKIVSAVSTITAAFNSELTPDLFKRYTVNTTAVTDTVVTAVKTVSAAAEFDSIAVKLIDSTVLSYDRALTLTVLSEFRTLSLHEEPLILMVEPETRVNMVRKTA
jgi:hypothetical protein